MTLILVVLLLCIASSIVDIRVRALISRSNRQIKISYSHIYIWRSRTDLPNTFRMEFGTQPPNLIPGYTVLKMNS